MSPRRKQQWSSLAILAIGLLVGPVGILAQTLDAVCLSTFNWVRRYALAWVFHSQITVPIARWTIAWARAHVLLQHTWEAHAMVAVC